MPSDRVASRRCIGHASRSSLEMSPSRSSTLSGMDDTGKARFERECQALGRLSSRPGIVTVYQAGFAETGQPYLVMEYFPKGSLADG